jgi:hypothetical protein
MHSKDQKVIKLLLSEDPEQQALGKSILPKLINEQTVVYWYIKLHTLQLSDFRPANMDAYISWPSKLSPANRMSEIYSHLKKNPGTLESVAEFMAYHDEVMLCNLIDNKLDKFEKSPYKKYAEIRHRIATEKLNQSL